MVKQQRILLMPDGNTGGESSIPSDGKGADSSTAEQVGNEAEGTEVETTEEPTESPEATAEETTEEQTPEEQSETEVETKVDEQEKEKFIPRDRFDEVNNKKTELETQLATDKPLIEQARVTNEFLRDNQITPQEYQSALQYLMLLRKDPAQAYAMLKPTYDQLALMQGERLPADLQAKVAAGTMDPSDATELAKARAQQNYQQWRQGQQVNGQQENIATQVNQTIQSWATTKQGQDPDFKNGTPLWEMVDTKLKAMPMFRSPIEAQQGVEQAYKEAKAFMQKFTPKVVTAVKKAPVSRTTSGNSSTVMKTAEDVMKAINAGVKPSQMKYS